jgi:alanyl-tRNA synthetase
MNVRDIRSAYLDFFRKRGHAILPSAPLVPENDPTTLFTGSGMQPLVPYLLGADHPKGARLADAQKSFRTGDIDDIGDNRHTTFFEMLGNWSLGDYFKKEQLPWIFAFLTNSSDGPEGERGLGLDPKRLFVTVFAGDDTFGLPRDTESSDIWKQLFSEKGIDAKDIVLGSLEHASEKGMQGGRIFYYEAKKNWWSRSGEPAYMPEGEPGGPDSEIFYEFSEIPHNPIYGTECHPNCDCGRYLEIGNSVFMEYKKGKAGFEKLPRQNVDFGGGLERLAAVAIGSPDIFAIDTLSHIIRSIEQATGTTYTKAGKENAYTASFRIVADHVRSSVFLIADGVLPSNADQGYFVRRLIRRAVRHLDKIKGGADISFNLSSLVEPVAQSYASVYPDVLEKSAHIAEAFKAEEDKFRKTLHQGMKEFEKIASKLAPKGSLSGTDAFILFTTYGFPLELTREMAAERGLAIDEKAFKVELEKHQELSRKGAKKKFKGGLADTSEMSLKYHTATHLLNAALREVLGEHIAQKGSNITAERLRFDFAHGAKMTPDEIAKVESIVNAHIKEALPVNAVELPIEQARAEGAIGVFGDKYGEIVKVYRIGVPGAYVSQELCGGPHVSNTSSLGHFKIAKEEAVSAGVRRIKAILS